MTIQHKNNIIKPATICKDTYRPHFCNHHFYVTHQAQFNIIKSALEHLDDNLKVILWTIALTCLRRPTNWYAGYQPLTSEKSERNELDMHSFFSLIHISWPQKLKSDITLFDFLHAVKIAPLPLSVHSAIFQFYNYNYPLKILNYEPSPKELLSIQITGSRIITFEPDYRLWPSKLYGHRDPLSFWIHDFIHAEHFFKDPALHKQQVGFYHLVHKALMTGWFDELFNDPSFENDFSYLISDMNSHPVHLLKTLNAHIDIHSKRLQLAYSWPDFISFMLQKRIITSFVYDNLKHINLKSFTDEHARNLTDYLNLNVQLKDFL